MQNWRVFGWNRTMHPAGLRNPTLLRGFHSIWTACLSVFTPNAGKYGREKLHIRTLFTQCYDVFLFFKKIKILAFVLIYQLLSGKYEKEWFLHNHYFCIFSNKSLTSLNKHLRLVLYFIFSTIFLINQKNHFPCQTCHVTCASI